MNNTTPIMSITRSYSEKVNVGNYQSKDFFQSLYYSWFDKEPTVKEITEKGDSLYELCRGMVMKSITEEMKHMEEANTIISERNFDKVNSSLQEKSPERKRLEAMTSNKVPF